MRELLDKYIGALANAMRATEVTDRASKKLTLESGCEWVRKAAHEAHNAGNKIIFIGNGGSAGIASHLAIDFSKNGGLRALAFNDPSALTCLGNDLGYENVVSLAGGFTDWSLAQGLGGGRSDAFQAGTYGTTWSGPAYISAALAVASYEMTTNRVALGDQLTANFNAQSYGGRLEGGYRYGMAGYGVTPYAALQTQWFHTPNYQETDLTGGGFGLAYNGMTANDTRSELGALRLSAIGRWHATYVAHARRLGARLGQQSLAHGYLRGTSRRELHR